jgi:hypothetical protein
MIQTAITATYDAGFSLGRIDGLDAAYRILYQYVQSRPALPMEQFADLTGVLFQIERERSDEHRKYVGQLNCCSF